MAQPTNQVSIQIENETPADSSSRPTVNLLRLDSVTRPVVSNRNNLGIGDRLHNVIREIRPLVEHARMVKINLRYYLLNNLCFISHARLQLYTTVT